MSFTVAETRSQLPTIKCTVCADYTQFTICELQITFAIKEVPFKSKTRCK